MNSRKTFRFIERFGREYKRINEHLANREHLTRRIFACPDEARKLIENYDFSQDYKKNLLVEFLVFSPQIMCLIFGDQRMGKDALICSIFQDALDYCESHYLNPPRIVTLGNVKKPPFVDADDMYFSFKSIPSGTKGREVWIYCSEFEVVLPARDTMAPENKLFAVLSGTMAQNHQKLFGCVKLSSKVDINAIRDCNVKLFKYIYPDKLLVEGVERTNILSELGMWLLPFDSQDKPKTLMSFDNQLFQVDYDLPLWWSDAYSEQFRGNLIPLSKIWNYIDTISSGEEKISASLLNLILTTVYQKFRKNLTKKEIREHFEEMGMK